MSSKQQNSEAKKKSSSQANAHVDNYDDLSEKEKKLLLNIKNLV